MLKDYATIVIGALTLVAASVTVYGMLNLNSEIQARQEQTNMPDYSTELNSLKSQIDSVQSNLSILEQLQNNVTSINEKLSTLDTLKTNISDIQEKLVALENKDIQTGQTTLTSANLALVLDKSAYFPGDAVQITAIGANPGSVAQVELLDSDGFVLAHKQAWADSGGKISYNLQLSNALPPASYQVNIVSGQQTASQPIMVETPTQNTATTTSSAGSFVFTAQSDKTVYHTGNLIQVSGTAAPNSTVTGVMTSPSGKTYDSATTANTDGSYTVFYAPTQPYETGTWNITMTNLSKTITIYVSIQ